MNISWVYLYSGVLMAAVSLPLAKFSQGFEKFGLGIAATILYCGATICWILAMRHISLSTAYIIWLGLDATFVLLVSYFIFHENFGYEKLICIIFVLIGCIGLNILEVKGK